MLARNYLSSILPILHPYDTTEATILWMNLLGEHHLAVVDRSEYLGFVDYTSLEQNNGLSLRGVLERIPTSSDIFVFGSQHVFDAIKLAQENRITIMPVLDEEHKYLGSISSQDFLKMFADLSNVDEPGDIIVLEMPVHQYLLSKIVNVIEENYAKVLNLYTTPLNDDNLIYVNIKISNNSIAPIISSLERLGYTVKYSFSDQLLIDDTKDHYDGLMVFLNT